MLDSSGYFLIAINSNILIFKRIITLIFGFRYDILVEKIINS